VSLWFDCLESPGRDRALTRATAALHDGDLVVVPTESSYGLACDAFSPEAVENLVFTRGSAAGVAPPVLIGHPRTLDGIAREVPDEARKLAGAFWPGGLTLILKAQPTLYWDLGGNRDLVSVRVPLHPVLLALLDRTGPLAVTAGNVVGHPVPLTCQAARDQLGEAAAVYLDAGEALRSSGSTIVDATGDRIRVVRQGSVTAEQLRAVIGDALEEHSAGE